MLAVQAITQNNVPNNWSGYWEIDPIARTATHRSGLVVVFDKKTSYVIEVSGIAAVAASNTAAVAASGWAGQAGALVEQAVNLWRGG